MEFLGRLAVQAADAEADAIGRAFADRMDRMMRLLLLGVRVEGAPSRTGMSVLATLRRRGPRRITELALDEHVTQPSMTNLVTRLADDGFVVRRADPGDGRAVRVCLTDEGRELQRRVRDARAAALIDRLAALTEEERAVLVEALPVMDRLLEPPA